MKIDKKSCRSVNSSLISRATAELQDDIEKELDREDPEEAKAKLEEQLEEKQDV